jgi:hypothetical protein
MEPTANPIPVKPVNSNTNEVRELSLKIKTSSIAIIAIAVGTTMKNVLLLIFILLTSLVAETNCNILIDNMKRKY